MAVNWERVREVFQQAVDLPESELRHYLDKACAGDAEMRAEVDRLLANHVASGGVFDRLVEPESAPGRELAGRTFSRYRIVERIGEGGMGDVYRAEDMTLGRTVALKFLAPHLLRNSEARSRFLREIRAVAALDHPNICTLYDTAEHEGQILMAMAYVDGPALSVKIAEGPLRIPDAVGIALEIAEGLREAHDHGIVHRDITPRNILLTAKGRVKVVDFGLAAISNRSRLTNSGTVLGTPSYMSPEQASGEKADHRSDIWSLGAVLYEMIAGKQAFWGRVTKPDFTQFSISSMNL